MIKNLVKAVDQAKKESRLWAYAAWTLPFIAIAVLVFEHLIGWDSVITKTLTTIAIVFFSISVFWWWWALNSIVIILDAMNKNEKHFEEIKEELRETRKTFRGE
jgi:hypothetical protein